MLRRCYDPYRLNKHPTYIDVFVCDEWLNFQNFAKWYEENYYEIEGQKMQLDKDILIKGNKIYSPEMCMFVPNRINSLFIKRQGDRGNECIGVHYRKDRNRYQATCSILTKDNKQEQIMKYFDTEREAFYWYKERKEKEIKYRADLYKNLIPKKLYEAMYNYQVEIND